MANQRIGNVVLVDTTGTISIENNLRISMILFTPSAANGSVVVNDAQATPRKRFKLQGATANETKLFDFTDAEIGLNNGLNVTVTNAEATFILTGRGG